MLLCSVPCIHWKEDCWDWRALSWWGNNHLFSAFSVPSTVLNALGTILVLIKPNSFDYLIPSPIHTQDLLYVFPERCFLREHFQRQRIPSLLRPPTLTLATPVVGKFIHWGRLPLLLDTSERDWLLGPGRIKGDWGYWDLKKWREKGAADHL